MNKTVIFLLGVAVGCFGPVIFSLLRPSPPDLKKKIAEIEQRHQAERELAEKDFIELEEMLKASGDKIDKLNSDIDGYTDQITKLKKEAQNKPTEDQLKLCLEREGLHEQKELSLREIIDNQGMQLIETYHFGTEYYNKYISKDWDLQKAEIRIAELENVIPITIIGGIVTGIIVRSLFK